jgi:hypothetical protein
MSTLIERSLLIPPELSRDEVVRAALATGGQLSDERERTYSGAAIQQWTVSTDPPLAVELHEFHMFDTRVWRLRGRWDPDIDRLEATLPSVPASVLDDWLGHADPLVRMRGLRAAAVLGEPWKRVAEHVESALLDEHAGMRWAGLRVLTLARWPVAADTLRRVIESNGDRMPPTDLIQQFADALDARRS